MIARSDCHRNWRRSAGYGVSGYCLHLPLMPRAKNHGIAAWHDHGLALLRSLDSMVPGLFNGIYGRRGSGKSELYGLGKISKGEFALNEQLYVDPFLL